MIFTAPRAVSELERNLILEKVRAGLRHPRPMGKRLSRLKKSVDPAEMRLLSAAGASWHTNARKFGVSVGTVFAVFQGS
jgi:DNA invertase Pin-like site-specific DNA recombinase